MANKLANLDEVIKKVRAFLPQYLSDHGINTERNFVCINPKHVDKGPSMSCNQNPENAYCFGCGVTADIFQAAHWLEEKPISGPLFIEENVKYLAAKYGVEIELEEMTEEELYRHRTYRAYKDAAALILSREFGNYKKVDEEINRRGWEGATVLKVGTVEYKDFRNALKAMGYEVRFQDEVDLGRPDIFNEDNMIFIIHDEWGRPVGFAARNLAYDGEHGAKYMNQKTTGLRCNIYQKGKRLYEIHTALKYTPPIYIFEGYSDVLTAQNAGLFNCCAIGGTAFTQQHLESLKQLGQYSIVLALDGDVAGQTRTAELLDKFFCGQRDLKVEILNLPDNMDPDDFIRARGLPEFLALKRWSAFEWRLQQYGDEANETEVCQTMIPLIVNESSFIVQDTLCGVLSKFTGVDKKTIKAELERLQNEKERLKAREKEVIVDQTMTAIKQNPDDAKTLLYECVTKIEQVDDKYDENTFSVESMVHWTEDQKKLEESLSGEFAGFYLSKLGLGGLGEELNGNWRSDVFMCFGGAANAGKTSMLCQMAFEIASNKDNDATVIYHSIDDSRDHILPRFVCQSYGLPDLTLNQVRNPNYYKKYHEDGTAIVQRRSMGYDFLMGLMKDGRIIVKDANDGISFAFGEGLIKYYQAKYPTRNVVYILDNLHKTPDFSNLGDMRMRFKALSNSIKNTATRLHVPILTTVEYTKLPPGTIPTNNNIAETVALTYDANFIGHLYNDLHERGGRAVCYHDYRGEALPRIRLGVGKNKITEFKDRLFLDFYPASGLFRCVATDMAERDITEAVRNSRGRQAPEYEGNGDGPEVPKQ